MCSDPSWLPPLMELSAYNGNWANYLDAVYDRFRADMLSSKLLFRGSRVSVRRIPETKGKGYGFWHCISEGEDEDDRIPDLERCKRIGWIRAVIENADAPEVDCWNNRRGRETHWLLWFREEYLVVLAERKEYYLLKTGYYPKGRRIERLRAERNAAQEKPTPP